MFELIGVTGWDYGQIGAMTFPQLLLTLEGAGQILYPRLRPHLDANFGNYSSEPGKGGKPSQIRQIILDHQKALRGERIVPTPEQQERAEAYRIVYREYLGEPVQAVSVTKTAKPIPGLSVETARAIVAFAEAGKFPLDVWARDVVGHWLGILATAQQE